MAITVGGNLVVLDQAVPLDLAINGDSFAGVDIQSYNSLTASVAQVLAAFEELDVDDLLQVDDNIAAISNLQSNITSLQNLLQGVDLSDIVANEGAISTLEANVTALQSSLATVQTDLSTAESDLTTLTGRVTTAESEIDSLETTQGTQDSSISTLQSDLSTLETSLTTLSGTVSTVQSDLTSLTGRVTTAESDISTLQSEVSTLQSGGLSANDILDEIKTVDGSGSGLDADLLDGLEAGSFLRSNVRDVAHSRIEFKACDTSDWDNIATADFGKGALQVYNDGAGNDSFISFLTNNEFGFYLGLDAASNGLAIGGGSMGAVKHKIWHEGNDGTGSGLDADTVDGNHLSRFYNALEDGYVVEDSRPGGRSDTDRGGRHFRVEFQNNQDGLNDGGSSGYHTVLHIQPWSDASGGSSHQLALTENGNLWLSTGVIGAAWGGWNKFWHSANFDPDDKADVSNTYTKSEVDTAVASAGASPDYQVFTSSGTWYKPAGLDGDTPVTVLMWGGGGGGSRCNDSNDDFSGGQGGGFVRYQCKLSDLSASESVVIGSGGGGGTSGSGQNGYAGGNTSFNGVTAYGGGPGQRNGKGSDYWVSRAGGLGKYWEESNYPGVKGGEDVVEAGAGGGARTGSGCASTLGGNGGSSGSINGEIPGGGGFARYNASGGSGARGEVRIWVG